MPARFAATSTLLEKDLAKVNPDTAVKNIDAWEESLKGLESKAGKAIVRDLEALKKQLTGSKPNGAKIKQLLVKLGEETTNSAEDAPENQKEKLIALGKQLSEAGTGGDDAEDQDED